MKLSKTQQAIVDKMRANDLIIDVNQGLGISGKTKATLRDKVQAMVNR